MRKILSDNIIEIVNPDPNLKEIANVVKTFRHKSFQFNKTTHGAAEVGLTL